MIVYRIVVTPSSSWCPFPLLLSVECRPSLQSLQQAVHYSLLIIRGVEIHQGSFLSSPVCSLPFLLLTGLSSPDLLLSSLPLLQYVVV